jgi:hypothetical protein
MPFKDPNSPGAKASNKRRFARWYAKNRARCLARMKKRYRNKKALERRQMKTGAKMDEATKSGFHGNDAKREPEVPWMPLPRGYTAIVSANSFDSPARHALTLAREVARM